MSCGDDTNDTGGVRQVAERSACGGGVRVRQVRMNADGGNASSTSEGAIRRDNQRAEYLMGLAGVVYSILIRTAEESFHIQLHSELRYGSI